MVSLSHCDCKQNLKIPCRSVCTFTRQTSERQLALHHDQPGDWQIAFFVFCIVHVQKICNRCSSNIAALIATPARCSTLTSGSGDHEQDWHTKHHAPLYLNLGILCLVADFERVKQCTSVHLQARCSGLDVQDVQNGTSLCTDGLICMKMLRSVASAHGIALQTEN